MDSALPHCPHWLNSNPDIGSLEFLGNIDIFISSILEPVSRFRRSCRQLGFGFSLKEAPCVGGIEKGIEPCTSSTQGRVCSIRIHPLQVAFGFWKTMLLTIALSRSHYRFSLPLKLVFILSASFWPLPSSYLQQHRFLQIVISSRRRIHKVTGCCYFCADLCHRLASAAPCSWSRC